MDNVTHALAGLLLAESAVAAAESRGPVARGVRRAALVLGVVTAELPDADLLYAGPVLGMGKLGYLLHHRGHTHTVVFALAGALLAWGVAMAASRGLREARTRAWLLALAVAGTLSHVALDWTNNYGVHPWWPVSDAWHYGDAVFIVEPWLWVAGIPPLVLLARGPAMRVLPALALALILAVAWRMTGMVERGVAVALTAGAALWIAVTLAANHTGRARPRRLAALGLLAWLAVEAAFATTTRLSRAAVRDAVAVAGGATLEEVALTPAVGNPLCHDALVVERAGPAYTVTRATVAALPGLRTAAACASGRLAVRASPASPARRATPAVRWGEPWSAPAAELAALARTNCVVAAALRFIRVPVWERLPDGRVRVADARFSRGGGGFAEVIAEPRPTTCPAHVPPWTPPRQALLDEVE